MVPKIIITQEGGIIQSVISDSPVEYMIIDHDIDGFDDNELFVFPGQSPVYAGTAEADIAPEFVEKTFKDFERLSK